MAFDTRRFGFLYFIINIVLLLAPGKASAQTFKRSINWLIYHSLADTVSPGRPSFRIYPTLAYAPETSLEIGFSTLLLFQANGDSNNRLSEINAFSFATLESQYGIWLDNALYGHRDNWFVLGRMRFQKFPLLYFGLGPDAPEEHPAIIDANYFIFRQRVLRKIGHNIFMGPEADYQNLYNTTFDANAQQPNIEIPPGTQGSANLGLGAALVYDNRHNVLNVRKGFFGELGFLRYSKQLGSSLDFTGINIDARYYKPVRKNTVLAMQFIGNFYTGNVPFNQMALMGGEVMMRGYYYGRYRDKNMLAAQAEYRWLPFGFSKRIGAAVFGGTAAVASTLGSFQADHFRLAGGAGIRYLLFPKKDIFIRLDVGATKDGFGFYFFTGEAF